MAADFLGQLTPALLGAVASGVVILTPIVTDALIYQIKVKRYMPLIRRTFLIIDPLLAEYIKTYGPSDVRFVINLATQVLADGSLSSEEAKFVYTEIEKRYSPEKAAGYRPLLDGTQEKAVYDAIKGLVDQGGMPSASDFFRAVQQVRAQVGAAG
jgi:hypothetical protein